jgi:hypothetical protein
MMPMLISIGRGPDSWLGACGNWLHDASSASVMAPHVTALATLFMECLLPSRAGPPPGCRAQAGTVNRRHGGGNCFDRPGGNPLAATAFPEMFRA